MAGGTEEAPDGGDEHDDGLGQPPAGLTAVPDIVAWAQQAPGVPVPGARVKELATAAVRGPAGFRM
ncbi:hypothetical protein [Kitasatospora azatica]|uniref:hypothetical protein n=1 Tax=Kitasatospora azatica TaxID=58347 RepID=UPI0005654AC9|nr:hypothetical protein [Kitasatospora azatica]